MQIAQTTLTHYLFVQIAESRGGVSHRSTVSRFYRCTVLFASQRLKIAPFSWLSSQYRPSTTIPHFSPSSAFLSPSCLTLWIIFSSRVSHAGPPQPRPPDHDLHPMAALLRRHPLQHASGHLFPPCAGPRAFRQTDSPASIPTSPGALHTLLWSSRVLEE